VTTTELGAEEFAAHMRAKRGDKSALLAWIELHMVMRSTQLQDGFDVIPCSLLGNRVPDDQMHYLPREHLLAPRILVTRQPGGNPKLKEHHIVRIRPWVASGLWSAEIQVKALFRRGSGDA